MSFALTTRQFLQVFSVAGLQKTYLELVHIELSVFLCMLSQQDGTIQISQSFSEGLLIDIKLIDVGGQRGERERWIRVFAENLTAVIFLTAISEFDQKLLEDDETNRLIESKRLFTSIIQNKYLIKTEIILFLNKKDVFIEKFGRGDFKKYVKKYTGPDDEPDKAIEHLKINVFEEVRSFFQVNFKKTCNTCPVQTYKEHSQHEVSCKEREKLYCHVTTAIDTENIKMVFAIVTDIIFDKLMREMNQ